MGRTVACDRTSTRNRVAVIRATGTSDTLTTTTTELTKSALLVAATVGNTLAPPDSAVEAVRTSITVGIDCADEGTYARPR